MRSANGDREPSVPGARPPGIRRALEWAAIRALYAAWSIATNFAGSGLGGEKDAVFGSFQISQARMSGYRFIASLRNSSNLRVSRGKATDPAPPLAHDGVKATTGSSCTWWARALVTV